MFTVHASGLPDSIWERHIIENVNARGAKSSMRYCLLYFINPGEASVVGFSISQITNNSALRIVTVDYFQGKWFMTNAVGIEQDAQSLEWCLS